MSQYLRARLACILLACGVAATASAGAEDTPTMEQCLGCHDFGPESPVHEVLSGSHGVAGEPADMASRRGCQDCHGDSTDHARSPTRVSPGVSFGPHWSATSNAQDGQCLTCHEDEGKAENWQHSLHMLENLTCVTCHDIHSAQDKVLDVRQQAEVCTVCHKAQKQGIHGMARRAARNPACTECHNPHDHETPRTEMLANQSAGCSTCHDLVRMAGQARVSDKAKSYHKVMARPARTCLDCHEGVAHAPADSVPPMTPAPVANRTVTLFYPGMADSDWLLQQHPGSQPLRQGANCQRCHRGEEAELGQSRGGNFEPSSRDMRVGFARDENELVVTLRWRGNADDTTVSLMWGDDRNQVFARGGCFAACHSDLPGMSRNRGEQVDKYLWASRSQQQSVGRPAIIKPEEELASLVEQGEFAELWRLKLDSGEFRRSQILTKTNWLATKLISINKSYGDGQWTVELRHKMVDTENGISFVPGRKYTFGIALSGKDNPGARHWTSLPLTLSFGGDATDFTAE